MNIKLGEKIRTLRKQIKSIKKEWYARLHIPLKLFDSLRLIFSATFFASSCNSLSFLESHSVLGSNSILRISAFSFASFSSYSFRILMRPLYCWISLYSGLLLVMPSKAFAIRSRLEMLSVSWVDFSSFE